MPLNVLLISMNGFGHINVALGIADLLAKRGHKSCFLLRKNFESRIRDRGYEFLPIMEEEEDERKTKIDPSAHQMSFLDSIIPTLKKPTIEQLSVVYDATYLIKEHKTINESFKKLVKQVSPDLIIMSTLLTLPSVETCGIPWIYFHTPSPHLLYKEHREIPPLSGYSSETDPDLITEFRKCQKRWFNQPASVWNQYLSEHGVGPINCGFLNRESPFLNIYAYPQALDFRDNFLLPKHFFRMDNAIREDDGTELNIPEEFLKREGKLIYVSMGSWFSGIVEVMERLVSILAQSPHKFIISRGPNHAKYELAENMWGERFLNQLRILPMVDLVITHGGNNSIVECLYYAKPMIVMPCFFDQHDNAQRIHEKGLGIRMNPFDLQTKQLLEAIEILASDEDVAERVKKVSQELQNSKTREEVVNLLEQIAEKKACPFASEKKSNGNHLNGDKPKNGYHENNHKNGLTNE